jgi:TonB family protein
MMPLEFSSQRPIDCLLINPTTITWVLVAGLRIKVEWTRSDRRWQELPSIDRRILLGALLLSLLFHFFSWISSGWVQDKYPQQQVSEVKIRSLTKDEKKLLEKFKRSTVDPTKIVETKLAPTAPPIDPTSLGEQDHATLKETKLAKKILNQTKAQNAATTAGENQKIPTVALAQPPSIPKVLPQTFTGPGTMSIGTRKIQPRNAYEKLFPDRSSDVFTKPNGGYLENIDADVAEGDRIDMNTSSFKFISYFTGLRKQIELVWVYPSDAAQRGLQGVVQLEMVVEKNGRVSKIRVIESSGYVSLDDSMVETIRLASPFAPLPKAWDKERLVITGSFHYILSYASH